MSFVVFIFPWDIAVLVGAGCIFNLVVFNDCLYDRVIEDVMTFTVRFASLFDELL